MKTIAKTIAVFGLSMGVIAGVSAQPTVVASDNSITSQLCVTAATGDALDMHKKIKTLRVSKEFVAEQLTCNGMPVAEFVEQYKDTVASAQNDLEAKALTAKVDY